MAKKIELPEPIIPNDNWKIVELGKYVKILNGYPFDSEKFTNDSNNRKPLVRIRDVVRGYTETFTDEDCPEEYFLKKNDMLIGMDGDFNLAKWQSDSGLLNQRVCKIESCSDELDNQFLFYYLPIPLKQINDATPSVTVKHLSSTSLQKLHFPLPTLEEQQRIVNRIETLFAKLDQAKEKAQNVVDTFETRKASILHKAFTGELTKKWRAENGVGDDSWGEKKLSECTSQIGDGLHGTPEYDVDGKYYFINGGNLTTTEIITTQETKKVNEEQYQKYKVDLNENTVLLSINGSTLGKRTAFYKNEPMILGKSACYINVNETLNKYFLRYLLCSCFFQDYAADKQTGSAIPNLGLKAIREFPLKLPLLSEQAEIVLILDKVFEKENKAKQSAEAVLEQIDLLKKSILARAFRGTL